MHQSRHRHFIHTALLLLVLSGAGHIHNHVCLDGQEPADLVHFENLGGHPDHADGEIHADVESEMIPQVLLTKVPDQDSSLFLIAGALLLYRRQPPQHPQYLAFDDRYIHHPPSELLPPLRAPPSRSS